MAIQQRRGAYADFKPNKMTPAEIAVVQSGDPVGVNGQAVYVAFQAGTVKRLATDEDIQAAITGATDEVSDRVDSVDGIAASAETSSTASKNYAVGDLLVLNDTLYTVTASISSGGTITPGTNVTATTVEAQIKAVDTKVDGLVDNTLAVSGKAADAKKTGDEITNLRSDFDVISGLDFHELPEGYTEKYCLEKISGSPLIDTGVSWQSKHPRIVLDVQSSGGYLFGNYHATSRRLYGGVGVNWFYGSQRVDSAKTADYINERITVDYSDSFLKIDDTTIESFDASGVNGSNNTVRLFGYKFTGSGSTNDGYADVGTKIYSAKFYTYTNNVWDIVFNGIPCVRNLDGKAGFYDVVGNSFVTYDTGNISGVDFPSIKATSEKVADISSSLALGNVTIDTIASYGNSGVYTSSFSFNIPFNGDYTNQIFTCVAKYEQSSGVTATPRIQFYPGTGGNRSTEYTIGNLGEYALKEWRTVRYTGDKTRLQVSVIIPDGVTLYIKDFYNRYDSYVDRNATGIRINGHRRLPMTPYDTLAGVYMAVKAGYNSLIEIPKRLSDGTWIFYHNDTLVYNDTYIRQADGSELPSTYNGTVWSNIDYETAMSWDWGISVDNRFAGTKPMRMEEFFAICAKTGLTPMLSIHSMSAEINNLAEIKVIAKKYGVLNRLGLKCPSSSMSAMYEAFGNDVESYTINVATGEQSVTVINGAIAIMDGLTGCTVRRVIELSESTAYLAYFGTNKFNAFELIATAGYECSIAQANGSYSPTEPSHNTADILPQDMEWWADNHGVHEYTDEYNWSTGLNW